MRISLVVAALVGVSHSLPTPDNMHERRVVHNPAEDGCHWENDVYGKPCRFFEYNSFLNASAYYCSQFHAGVAAPIGTDYAEKYAHVPDGVGGEQVFFANVEVHHKPYHDWDEDYWLIDTDMCNEMMEKIWQHCGGFGGWVVTAFGAVYGECIREHK
ncbi:hypothetical protein EV356DRAFT_527752 [Viridothelium virens]|uniref:Uncharacterized protein n=1 Tax=Viridothelium virens TaxID=1048519 RepID=A0A6A6HPW7_VIRVR|nr:hypothetical protein EV356DRAFT_527752 [Viridothelium virens]